jgi:hypothetical protein
MTRANIVMWSMLASIGTTVALGFFFVQRDAKREALSLRREPPPEGQHPRPENQQPGAPALPPLEVGPASGSRAERERAVLALLQGQVEARRLPVVASENGAPYDARVRDRLAPMRYEDAPRPSRPRRPGSDCGCLPGDPLCSCP